MISLWENRFWFVKSIDFFFCHENHTAILSQLILSPIIKFYVSVERKGERKDVKNTKRILLTLDEKYSEEGNLRRTNQLKRRLKIDKQF